jgi:sigma-B regulation protein RsbU (phosphoserine phosphatase)
MSVTRLMERANRLFCQSTLPSHYATLVCGQLSLDGAIEICNAGHCPPLLIRQGGVSRIEASGLPLGLFCSAQYDSHRVYLNAGESLVVYTDGITEAADKSGVDYGLERLVEVAGRCAGLGAQSLTECLLSDVENFRAGARKTDDVTLMVLRRILALH